MKQRKVVVIGGSVAGCLAAAAAARAGARVQVLERDGEPDGAVARKGTPQARQLHAFLDGGRRAAEVLLPGLSEDLVAHGACVGDSCRDVRWFHGGVWKLQTPIDRPVYGQTRPFLEWRVRQAVSRLEGVTFQFGTAVDQPVHEDGRVTGVRLSNGDVIAADLVVDASGRGTRLPRWLEAWGYGEVHARRVSLGLSYVSGSFTAPSRRRLDSMLVIYPQPPGLKRAGLCMRVEGDRCVVTLQGYHGEKPPTDLEGFREYARGLAREDLATLLEEVELIGELHRHTFPFQVRHAYEELPRFPAGIVPIGDAIASVDPVYGQGMSVAAMEAAELYAWLQAGEVDARAMRAVARVADPAWFMTTLEASHWPEAQGETPVAGRVMHWYIDGLLRACEHSESAVRAFYDVVHLTADLESIARPDLLAQVLWPDRAEEMTPDAARLVGLAVATLANPGAEEQRGPEASLGQQAVQHFEVRPDALHKCRMVNGPAVSLDEGQAVLRVEQFALTSNNVTYALVGREMGYFDLFPARPGWGCLPAWGFSRVIESRRPDLPEGELLFGFVPMATHWRMSVGDVEPHAVTDAAAHRQALLPVYNTHWRLSGSPLYRQEQQPLWSLYWSLFMTGFSMAAELEDARPPADAQVVISSASSKTALCLASALRSLHRERQIVGLTSPRHAAFVRETGLYDAVFSYEEVDQLEQRSSYFVDVAGHAQTLAAVHRQLDEQLTQSWMLGATNWHSFHGLSPDPTLPGPTPAFFFAPEHMAKRFEQWGLDGYMDRFAPAWMRFLTSASALVRVRHVEGERGLLAAYLQAFGGKLDPAEGLVVRL